MNSRRESELPIVPKRTRFLAIPHSRSMHDLSRQTISPSRTCVSATYRPAYAYPTRPVSFCPTTAPDLEQEPFPSSADNRRFSELPHKLDLGLPFGSLLEGDNFSLAKGRSYLSTDRDSPEAFPKLSHLSRYHGTGSSSGPSEKAMPSVENSSFTSSACTAPTSPIESDGDSTFYECAALDFPEPPPIGSPIIRRMRSSPWFLSADEVDGVLSVPGRGGQVALARLRRPSCVPSRGLKVESMKPTMNNLAYSRNNPLGFCNGLGQAGGMNANYDTCVAFGTTDQRNSALLDAQNHLQQHDFQLGNSKGPPHSSTSFGRLPRFIRKVASMTSESHRTQESSDAPNGSVMTFQRPVPKTRSFRSILPDSGNHHESPPREVNKKNLFWMAPNGQSSKAELEANVEKNKQKRQSSSRVMDENTLGPSFTHGLSWKEDFNTSFIDISPDRKVRSKGRGIIGKERVKSLLSKANEIFSWGRSQKKANLPRAGRKLANAGS